MARSLKKDLVKIIKDNPGCLARIDNDFWKIIKNEDPPEGFENWSDEAQDEWHESQVLIDCDDDFVKLGDGGYGSGTAYGGDILQALAKIVGIKIESV